MENAECKMKDTGPLLDLHFDLSVFYFAFPTEFS
jgi:hypothetical protein